ncbi:MAG: hypothetical protein JXB04_12170 [Kiritimatiellae bacterium]|nr:hypothetical protein [Kiritimatiellia bacterium]
MNASRIGLTWILIKYCWHVLWQDKEILFFTLLSAALCVLVFLAVIPRSEPFPAESEPWNWAFQGRLFLCFFWAFLITTFFNSAVTTCAVVRMRGDNPTLAHGFRTAFSRLPWITGWALLSATVILFLRAVEERLPKVGPLVRLGLGLPWALASFLVVPIMVVERQDPVRALKTSASLIKQTWGEQVTAGFSFFVYQLAFSLPAVLLAFPAMSLHMSERDRLLVLGLLAAYVVLVFLVISTLQTIFRAALYCYVRNVSTTDGVLPGLAAAAIVPEQGRA